MIEMAGERQRDSEGGEKAKDGIPAKVVYAHQ